MIKKIWHFSVSSKKPLQAQISDMISEFRAADVNDQPEQIIVSRLGVDDAVIDRLREAGLPVVSGDSVCNLC